MALPEDFSKIYGSTATGGLTPIGDVNYAKGWEFVGANPPTKNDFSYLQNLSDLKSQWLYSNKLQRTDPFGDIKSDGAAAVSTALANLGLDIALAGKQPKDATLTNLSGKDVAGLLTYLGFGSGNIESTGYAKIPLVDGSIIIQWGWVNLTVPTGTAFTFPTAFPNSVLVCVASDTGTGCVPVGLGSLTKTGGALYCAGKAYSASGALSDVTGGVGFRYIAIGR